MPVKNLPGIDYSRILKFLNTMSITPKNFRQQILLCLAQIFGFQKSTFFLADNNGKLVDPVALNLDERYFESYLSYYFKTDIFEPRKIFDRMLKRNVLTVCDLMTFEQYEKTEYHKEFLSPQGLYYEIAISLLDGTRLIGGIGLFRSFREKGFTPSDTIYMEFISPFIAKALASNLFLAEFDYQKRIFESYSNQSPVGLVIFDQFISVYYTNPAAREICAELLRKRTAENPPEQFLRNFLPGQNKTWQSGFRKTVLSPSLRLFSVHVFPVFHNELTIKNKELYVASLIPESLAPDHNFLEINTCKYNLTPRELEVLDLVLKGYSNQNIADALFVSLHTVKTHLQNIFKKMKVTNRTGLCYKMSQISQRY